MRALIFGCTGFVGSHLSKHLLEKGWEVVGVHRDWNPNTPIVKMQLYDKIAIARGDVSEQSFVRRVISKYEPDLVFLLSAQAIVKRAVKSLEETIRTNVIGATNVFETCLQYDLPVLFMSTDKVYGNRMNAREDDLLNPVDPYSISKACADLLAQDYIERGLDCCVVRSCNIFGYDLNPRIIPNEIRRCLRGEQPVIYEASKDHMRQYIYIDDFISAILLLVEKRRTVGVWNVGTDDIKNQEEVVKTICSFFDITPRYVEGNPAREIARQSVDWSRIRNLGFKPIYSFEEGIKETIEDFRRYADRMSTCEVVS